MRGVEPFHIATLAALAVGVIVGVTLPANLPQETWALSIRDVEGHEWVVETNLPTITDCVALWDAFPTSLGLSCDPE